MKNKELFTLNPDHINLKNEGVAKIRNINEKDDLAIAEYELSTFVCEGEYHEGLKKMLQFYLDNFDRTVQPVFWVSGFYGSGKSHMVKMAGYLWENFKFPNGKTARSIKALPQDIQDLFVEIDRKQSIQGKLTVAGTLRDFPSKDIRYSFLQLLLNTLGLPSQYHHFKFVFWAKGEGIYDELKALVEAAGKNFDKEIGNLFMSETLAKSILQLKPDLAENTANLLSLIESQFAKVETIGREDFVKTIKEEILPLSFGNKIPCTIIVLDEVQQFIGQDPDLADNVQFLAEDLCSRFDGKFLFIGTGQNALTDTPILQKLMARFRVPIQLSNTDIQTVIRKTVLAKKPSSNGTLKNQLDQSLGEISRNMESTIFGYLAEDKNTLVADYPLLPSTRKFWYKVLQVTDVAGTSGQLRNQLRLIDDGLKSIANKEVGYIVPADFIFTQNRSDLIQAGLLLNDTSNLIQEKKAKGGDSELEGRILSAVFLIEKITSEIHDTGLKSNERVIADLLIDNLNNHSDVFRIKIKELIKKLVESNELMPIGDEYKLQTKIGQEWEQEYSKQYIKINNSGDDLIHNHRREKIAAFFKDKTKAVRVSHGYSKMERDFELWDKDTMPNMEHKLNLWIRDGWEVNETTLINEIRAAGNNSPLSYAFVKRFRDTELKTEIVKFLAAGLTINEKGLQSTPEGEQAKKSMDTRLTQAKIAIQDLIEKICNETKIYLAGGNVVEAGSLKDNIQEALNSISDRQFPEFKGKADYLNWGQALRKAETGNPDALKAIHFEDDVDKHPVAAELLRYMGNTTKSGKDIRTHFMKAPYGWSQDAVDTILIMLKNVNWISASETDLKQGKINGATFKKEVHILKAMDKIAIRKLFQKADIPCPPTQELFPLSNTFLDKLKTLASQVSGDAPRPEPINLNYIKDIENKEGNERLLDILEQQSLLLDNFLNWKKEAQIASAREPQWNLLKNLTRLAPDNEDMEQLKAEITAIREHRLLLQEPDPIQPKLDELTNKLMNLLNKQKVRFVESYEQRMKELQANQYFDKLTPEHKHHILAKHHLLGKPEIKPADANALLIQLQKISLDGWDTKIAALSSHFQSALEDAILLSAPQASTFSLPRRTITCQLDIEDYVNELKTNLEEILKNSSSIILK